MILELNLNLNLYIFNLTVCFPHLYVSLSEILLKLVGETLTLIHLKRRAGLQTASAHVEGEKTRLELSHSRALNTTQAMVEVRDGENEEGGFRGKWPLPSVFGAPTKYSSVCT